MMTGKNVMIESSAVGLLTELLDLLPNVPVIYVERMSDIISVSRDWPSDHFDRVKALIAQIESLPDVQSVKLADQSIGR